MNWTGSAPFDVLWLAGRLTLVAMVAGQTIALPKDDGDLRWVRALVTVSGPASLTLRIRDRTVSLQLSELTLAVRTPLAERPLRDVGDFVAAGSLIEAHYATDASGTTHGILLVEGIPAQNILSKSPGHSALGTVDGLRRTTLLMRTGKHVRALSLQTTSTLIDLDGTLLATGARDIAALLTKGSPVLVILGEPGLGEAGSISSFGGRTAVTIRLLTRGR